MPMKHTAHRSESREICIIDNQGGAKISEEESEKYGCDAGKEVKGRKRHLTLKLGLRPFRLLFQYLEIETKKAFSYIGNTLTTAIQFLFIILINISLFRALNTQAVFGPTYQMDQILSYVAGYWIIRDFITVWIDFELANLVSSGSLLPYLCRPVHLQTQFLLIHLGQRPQKLILSLLLYLSVFLIYSLKTELTALGFVCLLLSMINAYFIAASFSFLFGQLAFVFDNARTLAYPKMLLVSLLGGGFFPITIFPETIQRLLRGLPFYYIYSVPLRTLSGAYGNFDERWLGDMLIGLAYGFVLLILGRAAFRYVKNKLILVGG
jgi:ABC-2 type transport system permease protein